MLQFATWILSKTSAGVLRRGTDISEPSEKEFECSKAANSGVWANVKEGRMQGIFLSTWSFLGMNCVVQTRDDVSLKQLN